MRHPVEQPQLPPPTRRPWFVAAALLLIACLPQLPPNAHAGVRPGFHELDVVVDRAIFDDICKELALDPTRRAIAERRFTLYTDAVREIDRRTREAREDAGLAEVRAFHAYTMRLQDLASPEARAIRRGEKHRYDEAGVERIHQLNYECEKVRWRGQVQAERYLDDWLIDFSERLELRSAQQQRVRRLIWRRLFTVDVREKPAVQDRNVRIDLIPLIEMAIEPDGELHALRRSESAMVELQSIVSDYDEKLFVVLDDRHRAKHRRPPKATDRMRYSADDPEFPEVMRENAAWFALRYDLLMRTAERVAAQAETHIGSTARDAWMDRVHATLFARIWSRRCLDAASAWVRERKDLSEVQRAALDAALADYFRERRVRRIAAIEATAQMSSHHYHPDPFDITASDRAAGRSVLELHRLSKRSVRRVAALLTPAQLQSFHEDVLGVMAPLKYGPQIVAPVLAAIDAEDEYAAPPLADAPDLLPDVIREQRKRGLVHPGVPDEDGR